METKKVFYIFFAAALIAFVCELFMGYCLLLTELRINFQPSHPIGTVPDFMRPIMKYPKLVLQFFATDSLFVLSYLVVFVGLFTVVHQAIADICLHRTGSRYSGGSSGCD